MDQFWISITTILVAIVGVAMVSVLVSKNSDTANVASANWTGFATALGVAVSPTTAGGSLLGVGGNSLNVSGNRVF